MTSSKLSNRRAVPTRPHVCHPPPPLPPIIIPPPSCECVFVPPNDSGTPESDFWFDIWFCCLDGGDFDGDYALTADGGTWHGTNGTVNNCSWINQKQWTAPASPGTYTLTCTVSRDGTPIASGTATMEIKEDEP